MKLTPPFPLNTISQGFGLNGTPMYKTQGLYGHTGIDFVPPQPWGRAIPAVADSYCYSLINKDNPDLSKYRAVYTIVDDGDFSYEISYGHCDEILATPKKHYKEKEILATVGNTGDVFVGGFAVTDRAHPSHPGAHLHFQVRKLVKIPKASSGFKSYLLRDANGVLERDGCYYQVHDYNNGYNGCVDPMPFFLGRFSFNRDMGYGQQSEDVLELQKRLGVDYSTAPGYFGFRTMLAVLKYQKANGILTTGYVGPITRASLNK